jgi:anti-anti-sigma factor
LEEAFRAELRDSEKAIIVDLFGDLSRNAQEPLFSLRNWEHKPEDKLFIILNLSNVPYINSLGIALLIRITRKSARAGLQTFAYGITPHYQKLFLMVGLTEHMMIYPDEDSILQRIATLDAT